MVARRYDMESMRISIRNHDAGLKVVDFVLKYPALAPHMCDFMWQLQKRRLAEAAAIQRWPSSFKRMSRLESHWWFGWLCFVAGPRVGRDDLLHFYHRDPKMIQQFSLFVTGLHRRCKLPTAMLAKAIAAEVFVDLAHCFSRLPLLCLQVRRRQDLDLLQLSPYKVHWDDAGLARTIEHSGDVAEVVPGLQFHRSWKLRDPLSDHDCAAVDPTGRFVFELRKFFATGQGPFKVLSKSSASLDRIAGQSCEAIGVAACRPLMASVSSVSKAPSEAQARQRLAALDRARQARIAQNQRLVVALS